jgi:predicted  nucleic acid-binding Zn-ribbon protein
VKLESYSNLLEARDQKAKAEKELQAIKNVNTGDVQKKYGDLSRELQKAEREIQSLKIELEQKIKANEKNENIRGEHLMLASSIQDLWTKFQDSEILAQMSEHEHPNMANAGQILEAISTLMSLHDAPIAGKKLRDLTGLISSYDFHLFPLLTYPDFG